ncbi:TetR/AcrR family transcriptional regulator [Paenibacillus arenilitoris]|uniref:TetR/AcrR family transcriptional regulator n=1 Tax=Paenibacillus arenilitoris TaxID=2772299 RepID=A0A927H572_9BACL|nr:TetR/AcrR family transcriptional regulator [Paenibacillus arenilitoris]MBD2868233.1 TetR/AcrR family transcriptional regulator [Paenibacillus arenilitoris]
MRDKTDPRIIRTKQMLRNALIDLINEKGFEGTTIRDLMQKAGLNRGTFYLHYRDKYDLLEQSKEDMLGDILEIVKNIDPIQIMKYAARNEPHPVFLKLFDFYTQHAEFFKVLLGPKGDPAYPVQLKRIMQKHLFDKLSLLQSEYLPVPREFIIAYLASANLGVIQHWLESGMQLSPREMALLITRTASFGALQTFGLKGEASRD